MPGHPGMKVPNGTKLWFRGAANLADTLAALRRDHGMAEDLVEELVLTGSSAGGLATILNVDRVAALTGAQRVVGLADAGYFKYDANHSAAAYSSSANYSADMRYVYGMVNASDVLNPACRTAQLKPGSTTAVPAPGGLELPPKGPWNCMVSGWWGFRGLLKQYRRFEGLWISTPPLCPPRSPPPRSRTSRHPCLCFRAGLITSSWGPSQPWTVWPNRTTGRPGPT